MAMTPAIAMARNTAFQPKAEATILPSGTPMMSDAVKPMVTLAIALACLPGGAILAAMLSALTVIAPAPNAVMILAAMKKPKPEI